MKLDPIFTVKNNKLYKIDDNSQTDINTLKKIELSWSKIELEPEIYNEEFLATLREELKPLDDQQTFVILVPIIDKPLDTPDSKELFINAFNHTARRIKDCTCIAGFELPEQLTAEGFAPDSFANSFMETLAIKHAQYVYFANTEKAPTDRIVLYNKN